MILLSNNVEVMTMNQTNYEVIFNSCPHFDDIINNEIFLDDDSNILIDWYKDLIFMINTNDQDQLNTIHELDKAVNLYTSDRKYAKELRDIIDVHSIINSNVSNGSIVKSILEFTNNYMESRCRNIENTIWI